MHDVITIGHDQTAKFKFANILLSRFSGKIAKFFARQYFGVYGMLDFFPVSYFSCVYVWCCNWIKHFYVVDIAMASEHVSVTD